MNGLVSQDKLSILLYHGVTKYKSHGIENKSGKHIAESDFISHAKWLKSNCTILSMDQVVEYHNAKKPWPKNSIAITFDDGFENNYSVAAPILDGFGLSATFYVASGVINTDLMFWVDRLEDCLNLANKTEIAIKIGGNDFVFDLESDKSKQNTLFVLKQYCKNCSAKEKDEILLGVEEETEVTPSVEHSDNYKKLNWNELREMCANPLFSIGGHSVHHNILSKLSYAEMRLDIHKSVELLKQNLGFIKHYSYPEGRPEHFNHKTVQILKNIGIVCSPTTINGFNDLKTNLFLLRRNHTNSAKIY